MAKYNAVIRLTRGWGWGTN